MRANDFRRLALGMGDAIEAAHMGHPDFRVNGRIFATLSHDNRRGMVALTPDQQAEFLREHPAMFAPASGAWGLQGATMVELAVADENVVGEAMTLAWQAKAQLPATRKSPKKKSATKKSATKKPKRASKAVPRARKRSS